MTQAESGSEFNVSLNLTMALGWHSAIAIRQAVQKGNNLHAIPSMIW